MKKRRRIHPDEGEIHFRCAACGGDFCVPEHPGSHRPHERRIVRIGGETWCEPCAKARHHRTHDFAGLLGPQVIIQENYRQ